MKPLSKAQYGALLAVADGKLNVQFLRMCRDVTMWSLFKRGYLCKQGRGLEAFVLLTDAGVTALNAYRHATLPLRQCEADLTERLRHYLGAVVALKKVS